MLYLFECYYLFFAKIKQIPQISHPERQRNYQLFVDNHAYPCTHSQRHLSQQMTDILRLHHPGCLGGIFSDLQRICQHFFVFLQPVSPPYHNMIKKTTILLCSALVIAVLAGCHNKSMPISGDWVKEGTEESERSGFCLSRGGSASSINDPETLYTQWRIRKRNMILSGKRFENHRAVEFCDTLHIVRCNDKRLVLSTDSNTVSMVHMYD